MSRYRSYHGASVATSALTGDQRRWPVGRAFVSARLSRHLGWLLAFLLTAPEMGATGVLKFFDPFPYSFSFGATEEEVPQPNLVLFYTCLTFILRKPPPPLSSP